MLVSLRFGWVAATLAASAPVGAAASAPAAAGPDGASFSAAALAGGLRAAAAAPGDAPLQQPHPGWLLAQESELDAVQTTPSALEGNGLEDLRRQRERLLESRPGVGGAVGLMAAGGGACVAGILLGLIGLVGLEVNRSSASIGIPFLIIGIAALVAGAVLLPVGASRLGNGKEERGRIDAKVERLDARIEELEKNPRPPAPLPAPPQVQRNGGGRQALHAAPA